MEEISNNILAVLVIIALVVSITGTMTAINILRAPAPITGYAEQLTQFGEANVTVASEVVIWLMRTSIDFNTLGVLEENDTENLDPLPFVVRNNGTVYINISVGAKDLWATVVNPTSNYQYNYSDNDTSVSVNAGATSWTDMDAAQDFGDIDANNATLVENLSYKNNERTINTNIRVKVPSGEVGGSSLGSTVFFEAVSTGA